MKYIKVAASVLFSILIFILAGCSAKGVDTIDVVSDVGSVTVSVDGEGGYSLQNIDGGFEILNGHNKIRGVLMSADDADQIQADGFVSSNYNVISVNGNDGFAISYNGAPSHFIPVDDFYMVLSVTDKDAEAELYAVEEHLNFVKK